MDTSALLFLKQRTEEKRSQVAEAMRAFMEGDNTEFLLLTVPGRLGTSTCIQNLLLADASIYNVVVISHDRDRASVLAKWKYAAKRMVVPDRVSLMRNVVRIESEALPERLAASACLSIAMSSTASEVPRALRSLATAHKCIMVLDGGVSALDADVVTSMQTNGRPLVVVVDPIDDPRDVMALVEQMQMLEVRKTVVVSDSVVEAYRRLDSGKYHLKIVQTAN